MFVSFRHWCEMDFLRNLPEPFLIATIHQLYSNHRGEVKDPSFETKAKDIKNPSPRPRTALRKTGPLEAKDRNAPGQLPGPRTQALVFSKDKKIKDLQQVFQAISKKRSSKFFFRRSPIEENKKRSSQILRKVSSVSQQNFNGSKNNAVLETRTEQFSRTSGFKTKDLTFEAKDFKMCPWGRPRGQGRPQGLHIWVIIATSDVKRSLQLLPAKHRRFQIMHTPQFTNQCVKFQLW